MSWDEWKWWWGDRDQMLRERAEELESRLGQEAATHRRTTSQLSKVQGTLEKRLDRLSAAFDAFVELSDVRTELAAHAPAAVARQRVRRLLDVLGQAPSTSGAPPSAPPPPPDDVPGYWLVPAVQALVAQLANLRDAADAALTEANHRDEVRTRRFLVYAYAVLGRGHEVVDRLAVELDAVDPAQVTPDQRALWMAAADGVFGDEGHGAVARRVTDLARRPAAVGPSAGTPAWVDDSAADGGALAPWLDACRALGGGSAGRSRSATDDARANLAARIDAGRALQAVASRCEAAFERDARDAAPEAAFEIHCRTLERDLRTLLEEGTAEEAPLLRRITELRRVIDPDEVDPDAPAEVPGGPFDELLRTDAFASDPGAAKRQAIALRAARPWLDPVLDRLAREAEEPLPDAPVAQPAPDAALERPADRSGLIAGWVIAAVGGLLVIVGLVAAGWLIALGVLAIALAVYLVLGGMRAERQQREAAEHDRTSQERRRAEREALVLEARTQAMAGAEAARQARSRLRELLAAESPPSST
jgi:hypothetical protein